MGFFQGWCPLSVIKETNTIHISSKNVNLSVFEHFHCCNFLLLLHCNLRGNVMFSTAFILTLATGDFADSDADNWKNAEYPPDWFSVYLWHIHTKSANCAHSHSIKTLGHSFANFGKNSSLIFLYFWQSVLPHHNDSTACPLRAARPCSFSL